MHRNIDIEALCADKGLRITEQRRTIARILSEAEDHPDVETLHARGDHVVPAGRDVVDLTEPPSGKHEAELGIGPRARRTGGRAGLAIGDHPDRAFQTYEWTADWTYLRLNHGAAGPDDRYSQAELERWAKRISGWRDRGDIYVYMNSDEELFAVRDGEALESLLA